ncbi:MAG: hypothetical protein GXP41_05540, partial [Chloroflexi bacterium]|nr:hypothetical protein [Chloroflexota bacterium]
MQHKAEFQTPFSRQMWIETFLLSLFALAPLTHPGLWQSQAGFVPLYRLLRLGQTALPTALQPWALPFGADLSGALREGPLPYLLGVAMQSAGISPAMALKVVAALGLLIAAGTTYVLASAIFRLPWAGLLAGVLYLYAPPLLTTLYARGRLAELWALALFPALIWAHRRSQAPQDLAVRFLLAALITLCQPGLAVILVGLAVAYALWRDSTPARFRVAAISTVAGLGAGLLGWSAMLLHAPAAKPPPPFFDRFLYPAGLFASRWPMGLEGKGPPLGLAIVLLAIFSAVQLRHLSDKSGERREVIFFLVTGSALALVTLQPAAFLWRLTRLDHLLLAPWQLLGPAALLLSLGGIALLRAEPRWRVGLWPLALVLLILLPAYPNLSLAYLDSTPHDLPLAVFGDGQIALVGATLQGTPAPGETVTLLPRWQALRPLDQDYTLFVHLVDAQGNTWGQRDAMPRDGQYPTSAWPVGEVIPDSYAITVKPEAPVAGLHLEIGWYLLS